MNIEEVIVDKNILAGWVWPVASQNKNQIIIEKSPFNYIVTAKQARGNKIVFIDKLENKLIQGVDGFITNQSSLGLAVSAADCLLVLGFDPDTKLVGALHAGWQGLSTGAIENWVECFNSHGSNSNNLKIAIGPHSQACCYEVDNPSIQGINVKPLFKDFLTAFFEREDKIYFDLAQIAKEILARKGVNSESIRIDPRCTICDPIKFPSWRREKSKDSIVGIIGAI